MTARQATTRTTDQFCERLLTMYNGAALSMMISIGHRTALFDTMTEMPPATSEEIAQTANLDERYVREWLGAMVTGGIVDYDATMDNYMLPPEHAAALTRAASPNNMASIAQWFAVLGGVEDKILERFRSGGGLCYKDYHRFHEVMAEESDQTTVAALMDTILPVVPGIVERLRSGATVLDVGCGSGMALIEMARNFPASRFVGYDMCEDAVNAGTAEIRRKGLTNVVLVRKDVADMEFSERFDMVTAFDAIHDQARPDVVLKNIARALKPDGVFLMQDIRGSSHVHRNMENPLAPFIYTISCMHCMSVSLGQNGMGLGAAWGEELALCMLRDTGFRDIEVRELPHDILNSYYICHKSQ
jgi:ubiquinone/menaquinone biosynthesis C-methylase UbiE